MGKNKTISVSVKSEFNDVYEYIKNIEKQGGNRSRIICLAIREYMKNGENKLFNDIANINHKLNKITKQLANGVATVNNKQPEPSNDKEAEKQAIANAKSLIR
ncbi:MAG: hypothetical protein ACOCUI_00295 [bacterium]